MRPILVNLPISLYEEILENPDTALEVVLNSHKNPGSFKLVSKDSRKQHNFKIRKIEESDLYMFSVFGKGKASLKDCIRMKASHSVEFQNLVKDFCQFDLETSLGINVQKNGHEDLKKKRVFKLNPDEKAYTMSSLAGAIQSIQRKELKLKRKRTDKSRVKEALVTLFKRQKYWKLKSLSEETNQPEAYVKEILSEVADKVTSGPYKFCYALKSCFEED